MLFRSAGAAAEEASLSWLGGLEGDLRSRLEALEAKIVHASLIRHRWNKTRTAAELGLSRVGLRAKLVRWGLERAGAAEDGAAEDGAEDANEAVEGGGGVAS